MTAIMIIALGCLGLLFATLASAQAYAKKIGNPGANGLYIFFYTLILIASISVVILYIK